MFHGFIGHIHAEHGFEPIWTGLCAGYCQTAPVTGNGSADSVFAQFIPADDVDSTAFCGVNLPDICDEACKHEHLYVVAAIDGESIASEEARLVKGERW